MVEKDYSCLNVKYTREYKMYSFNYYADIDDTRKYNSVLNMTA